MKEADSNENTVDGVDSMKAENGFVSNLVMALTMNSSGGIVPLLAFLPVIFDLTIAEKQKKLDLNMAQLKESLDSTDISTNHVSNI